MNHETSVKKIFDLVEYTSKKFKEIIEKNFSHFDEEVKKQAHKEILTEFLIDVHNITCPDYYKGK